MEGICIIIGIDLDDDDRKIRPIHLVELPRKSEGGCSRRIVVTLMSGTPATDVTARMMVCADGSYLTSVTSRALIGVIHMIAQNPPPEIEHPTEIPMPFHHTRRHTGVPCEVNPPIHALEWQEKSAFV